jgi:hypothetical protein
LPVRSTYLLQLLPSRCCPKCQAQARQRWVEALLRDLLTTNYFHVVFTVPHELNPLALTGPTAFYDLLFAASSQAPLETAAEPQRMGAEISFLSILHTWGSNLMLHPHIRCVIPGGGLSPDHQCWVPTRHPLFLLPIPVLCLAFRKRFTDGLERRANRGPLALLFQVLAFPAPDCGCQKQQVLRPGACVPLFNRTRPGSFPLGRRRKWISHTPPKPRTIHASFRTAGR